MPEKILRAIFVLLFTVLGIVLSRQGETVLALLLPNSVLTETILGITFMSLAAMLVGGIFGAIIGSFISPYLIKSLFMFTSTVEKSLSAMSTQDLIAGFWVSLLQTLWDWHLGVFPISGHMFP